MGSIVVELTVEFNVEVPAERRHSLQHPEQLRGVVLGEPLLEEPLQPGEFHPEPFWRVACGPLGDPLGEDELGDGVVAVEQLVVRKIEELAGQELEPIPAAPELVLVEFRPPPGIVIGEDGEADHWPGVEFEKTGVVPVHPEGHLGGWLGLGLDVEQSVIEARIGAGESDEPIGMLTSMLRIGRHFPELGVEIHHGPGPIDAPMDLGLQQLEDRLDEDLRGLLPGAVEIGCGI